MSVHAILGTRLGHTSMNEEEKPGLSGVVASEVFSVEMSGPGNRPMQPYPMAAAAAGWSLQLANPAADFKWSRHYG